MVKYTHFRRLLLTNCLSVFGHFVALALKGLMFVLPFSLISFGDTFTASQPAFSSSKSIMETSEQRMCKICPKSTITTPERRQ